MTQLQQLPSTKLPNEDRVSAARRFILNLDLHPILVHAPQTFATFLPGLAVVAMLLPALYSAELRAVVCFTALVLPVSVVGAILSGPIDGKVKFKRLGVPLGHALMNAMVGHERQAVLG